MPEITPYCPCGAPLINGKCSRKRPIKACKGEVAEKRKRYSGKSKFFDFENGKTDFSELGYAK